MGWLDQFFKGYETILSAGKLLTARARINYAAPLEATDDATNKWTNVAIAAASSTARGTLSTADYAKLQALAPSSYLPARQPTNQPATASLTAQVDEFLAYAPANGSSLITSIACIAGGALTADATDYRVATIYDVGPTGLGSAVSVFTTSTRPSPTGTGNWVATMPAFTWTPVGGHVLVAEHKLLVSWGAAGLGVAMPNVAWQVT